MIKIFVYTETTYVGRLTFFSVRKDVGTHGSKGTSHSAYVATNTESNGAKIDGF